MNQQNQAPDSRPYFVDNRNGVTLDKALCEHLRLLREQAQFIFSLDIATAFFNVPGFDLLADEFCRAAKVRLLLGAEPRPEAERVLPQPGDPAEPQFTARLVSEGLSKLNDGLARSRDLLPFDEQSDAGVRRLLAVLHSGRVEVRRYTKRFLHAKAFLFRTPGGGLVTGSSNLTYAGLRRNLELNLGHFDVPAVPRVEVWFDELWENAELFDLAAIYDRLMAEYPPYLIYLRVLFALYGEELAEEEREMGEIPLTTFQQHGVWRALRIMKRCGGVLIADGVGLGKTFLAGDIIRLVKARRQRVLLICPAALRDSTWRDFLDRYDLKVDCVSYEQLANDRQLGGEEPHLRSALEDYALVVIDESHAYRNPDAPARAGVLRRLLLGPRRDLVMMTATPVNNSLWDLYHLLRYFVKQDAFFADRGVLSLRERFQDAMHVDPFNLNPDMLYPVIDATTVKRTREFIKRHYANDLVMLPDGTRVPIQFPKPVASSITYDLETILPGFMAELETALDPPNGSLPLLTLARYQPENYPAGQPPSTLDTAIVGLIRSGLLKRFESSVHAFACTTEKMAREHGLFLKALDQGIVLRKTFFKELSAAEGDDELIEELMECGDHTDAASKYDVATLRRDAESDRKLLAAMHQRAAKVKEDEDIKLAVLVEELVKVVRQAQEDAATPEDERRCRKVLVFSFYEDTVNWIEGFLDRVIERDKRLSCYRGRTASVAGNEVRHGVSRRDAVWGFAPESSGAPPGSREDRFDLLVCTDVLAEGLNLQQSCNIINFDMPWNPMRLVQRHGRIDRIGSPHKRVFLRTYFPDAQLDALLNLEARVRRKLAQAAASVGVEVSPIERGSEGQQSFTETREEIERLRQNDPTIYERGGTASAAQTGEEYRQELRKALMKRGDEIRSLPWKAGSGMAKGNRRGHFFCATVGKRVYLRLVPFDGGELVSEIGTCLRLIECAEDTPKVIPQDLKHAAFTAWQKARQDIFNSWTYETDPANLQPKVPALNRAVADHIRQYPPSAIDQQRLARCLEAVEAPCSIREQKMLRTVFEAEHASADAKSRALIAEIERIGLEPFQAPEPLPPIQPDDVHLICWIAIETA
jgi:hypothetical protein